MFSQFLILFLELLFLGHAVLVCNLKRLVSSDARLLGQLLVHLVELGALVLGLGELSLSLVQFLVQLLEFIFVPLVLSFNVLHLLTGVREHDDVVDDFTAETGELLVSFFDFLV